MNSCYLCLLVVASIIIMAINWKLHHLCAYALHTWIMVDYAAIIVFRLLMFVDDRLAAGIGLDLARQQGYIRFCARIVLLSVLIVLLYPFLWVWTIVGTIWFARARDCVSFFSYTFVSMTVAAYVVNMIQNHFQLTEEDAKFGYLIWLLFSYCGLVSIACICIGKWLTRRQAHQLRAQQQGIPMSEFRVLVDLVRVPDRTSETAGQRMRGAGQDDAAYNPGLYSTPAQGEPVEALIQELPKFRLKAVPTECSECLICLEEFHVGNEVRGLPCAHNFHVECIDKWLQLNAKCPRCRCSANLDLRALSNIQTQTDPASPSPNVVATTLFVRNQPRSPNYLLRFQGLLSPVQKENAGSGVEGVIVEMPGSQGEYMETVQVVVDESALPRL